MFGLSRSTAGHGLLFDEDLFLGVCLGWNRSIVHKNGIAKINKAFGLDLVDVDKYLGIDRYRIRRLPPMVFLKTESYTCVGYFTPQFASGGWPHPELALSKTQGIFAQNTETFAAAWDPEHFAVLSTEESEQYHLRNLHDAFQRRDVAIFQSRQGEGQVLNIVIPSKIPQKFLDSLLAAHEQEFWVGEELARIDGQNKILSRFKEKTQGKAELFAALPPPGFDRETKYSVLCELVPYHILTCRPGVYTVEEILEWLDHDKGPVSG